MRMADLIRYDVPREVVRLWEARESDALLPLQELAVKRHGLFDDGNLLIQAPTSSGKTFVGEMAAIRTALTGKQVVYLVPLKALAEEKFADFRDKYTDYGLRVIISTRDRRDYDADLESGNFSIAIVVYEKLSQLLVRRPERLQEVDLVIADELEILSDPERGAMCELLLTRILEAGRRLIGLSAVIGGADHLAEWMRAQLVQYERRPVELRYGIVYNGHFRYRTYNDYGEGEEAFASADADSTSEILAENITAFVAQGESCLVFVKSKHEARMGAERLAARIGAPPANDASETLRRMEGTRCRDSLLRALAGGVAFHSTDLAPEEREVIEQAFRAGEVRVMVSTSTLAVGLNLPARNVFLSPEKWRYEASLDMPWKTPLLHMEYENMGGRAGRYGAGHEYGRSILIATSAFEFDTLWRRYIEGEREKIAPQLAKMPLENPVLRLVASRSCRTAEEVSRFLEQTLTGRWIWTEQYTLEEIELRIRAAINRCVERGVLASDAESGLSPTPLGTAIASKGITLETARMLEQWTVATERRELSSLELLFTAATTPDGRMPQVMLTAQEYDGADYAGQLRRMLDGIDESTELPVSRLLQQAAMPHFEDIRAAKIALFLGEWIEEAPLAELEENYNTMAGQVLSASEQVSWIIDAAAAIAQATGLRESYVDALQALALQVQHGLREAALPMAHALHECDLPRSALVALHTHGLHTPAAIVASTDTMLNHWIPPAAARVLRSWAQTQLKPTETPEMNDGKTTPILVIDDAHPDRIYLDGQEIPLQEKQYRLARLLSTHAGECVPYEEIYSEIWGDAVVEDNQMHFQKRKLLKAVEALLPAWKNLVVTVPKRGFRLNLRADQVALRQSRAQSAA